MKICAIICEFNPFHNGHKYLLDKVRAAGGFDGVLCIMSGHFTQRGERAVADKFTRAGHAVTGGADAVIELPAPFAVAPAPVFAEGAVKLACSIPDVRALAFGCENKRDFKLAAAGAEESEQFKNVLASLLSKGEGYAKSYAEAIRITCGEDISLPNDILAFEYAKAVNKLRGDIELLPVKRMGAAHGDRQLGGTYSSASAIRARLGEPEARAGMPAFSADLRADRRADDRWNTLQKYALFKTDEEEFAKVYGGGEGLANRIKRFADMPFDEMVKSAAGKRYTEARIRRALACNALGLTARESNAFLHDAGYIKPLAVKREKADALLAALSEAEYPLSITGDDAGRLDGANAELYRRTAFADGVWETCAEKKVYDHTVLKI